MLVTLYNFVTKIFRQPKYQYFSEQVTSYHTQKLDRLKKHLQQTKVQPGQAIFFWNKKINYIDHIAIVPTQEQSKLNLLDAQLLQGAPPPLGGNDYSALGFGSALEYMGNLKSNYSRLIIGAPPTATKKQLKKAGKLAHRVGQTKKIDGKIAFYGFPIISKFIFVKWFHYYSHLKMKIGLSAPIAKKKGESKNWTYTYCGDLVGRIYQQAGIKNLPKINFFGRKLYRSSDFYKWMKENDAISEIIMWNDEMRKRY